MAGLFSEVKRRRVVQATAAYAVVGWLLIQVAVTFKGALDLPARVDSWVTIAVIAGFPIAILLAWLFDFSLAGIKLTQPEPAVSLPDISSLAVPPQAPAPKHSIAVLPFSDMSAERDQGYPGDGVAEEILNALVKVTPLKVSGRTSSFSFLAVLSTILRSIELRRLTTATAASR